MAAARPQLGHDRLKLPNPVRENSHEEVSEIRFKRFRIAGGSLTDDVRHRRRFLEKPPPSLPIGGAGSEEWIIGKQ